MHETPAGDGIMPTHLNFGDTLYEVVSAIYVPPLYGRVQPCWIAVVRVRPAVFQVCAVTLTTHGTYLAENASPELPCADAHRRALARATDRYGQ